MTLERIPQRLRDLLEPLEPGAVPPGIAERVVSVLESCWNDLQGATDFATYGYKLRRAESLTWRPPILSFVLERHGGTVFGSTRAELHAWTIDLESGAVDCDTQYGRRQLRRAAPALYLGDIAKEVTECILSGGDHAALRWSRDRSSVRLLIGEIIPDDGFKQTISGRRRRFRKAVSAVLSPAGWAARMHGSFTYYERATIR